MTKKQVDEQVGRIGADLQFKLCRLAIRQEGRYVNAYFAKPDTMDGAFVIATVLRQPCEDYPELFEEFKALATHMLAKVIEATTGRAPDRFVEEAAPEHERSGNA